jgi:hypothetical protein
MVMDKTSFEGALRPKDRHCSHETVYRTHCLECGEVFVRFRRTEKEREVRVSAVLEQGFKTRPVTVNCGAWGTLMHLPRLWLFNMLGRCPEIPSLYLLGKRRGPTGTLKRGLAAFAGREDWEINSLDLSAATDNFSKELCASLYEGFTANCPPLIREIGRETFRPVTLVYNRKGGVERVRSTRRGILMGDPTSWSVLNLHNIFLWRLADEIDAYQGAVLTARLSDLRGFKVPMVKPGEGTVIRCGDDQLAVSSMRRARNFEALLNSVGAVISVGAHFASREWGFYTKCIFRVRDGKPSFYDYFPARFVTGAQRTRPGERQIPPWWNIGSATETGVSWFHAGDVTRRTEFDHAFWVAGYFFRKPVRALLRQGIEPFLPRELGGFGLADAHGRFRAITGAGKAVWEALLRDDLSLKAFLHVHVASFVWALDPDQRVAAKVEETVLFLREYYPSSLDGFRGSEAERVLGDPGNPLGIARDPELPYSLQDALDAYSAGRFELYGDLHDAPKGVPPLWKIAKRFRTFAEAIRTPFRVKKHALPWEKVRELLARANCWRVAKLPNRPIVELCSGFRKVIPTDTHHTRETANRRRPRIDFVPGGDLSRILRAAGVHFPADEKEAHERVLANRERAETAPIYFGTRVASFNAILRAPPSKGSFDQRGVVVEPVIRFPTWLRGDLEEPFSEAEPVDPGSVAYDEDQ